MSNTTSISEVSSTKVHGGWLKRVKHDSTSTNTEMTFAVFLPPQAETARVPVLYWLSGLTCTDENFTQKSGGLTLAAQLGLAIVCPDTSPRGTNHPLEHDAYDFGSGAGFYVNATQAPWSENYRMFDYVTQELPLLIETHFSVSDQRSISGHSMGGHGALICALKNPGLYQSVSAFAPISNPMHCQWGIKALSNYLGEDQAVWKDWDSCELVNQASERLPVLVDQGLNDDFLAEQLQPQALISAFEKANYPLQFRSHEGYDHSYFFIATFINDHLRHHAYHLNLL